MAPEVLEGNRYTEQADIYSFGTFLSELDTGDTPFKDICSSNGSRLSPSQVISLVLTKRLQLEVTANCPTMISEIVMECLCSDPSQRPTAANLVARLTDRSFTLPLSSLANSPSFAAELNPEVEKGKRG